jgi:transposase InsO family protein
MELSLSRRCELVDEGVVAPLWRLFGLVPQSRRRSSSRTASGVPGSVRSVIGHDPQAFSQRFEGLRMISVIEPETIIFLNIRETIIFLNIRGSGPGTSGNSAKFRHWADRLLTRAARPRLLARILKRKNPATYLAAGFWVG